MKILFLLVLKVSANFNVRCFSSLVDAERVDPIVSYGKIAGHAHTVVGGNNFSPISSAEDLSKSECTTCDVRADKSSYWVPTLYNYRDGKYEKVRQIEMRAYYFENTGGMTWPKGFEAVFGDPKRRTPHFNVRYLCWGGPGPDYSTDSFPPSDKYCTVLQAETRTASCWDGVRPTSNDQTHMFNEAHAGVCPQSHPIKMIRTQIESHWDLRNIPLPRNLSWSMEDTTGYGYHADFINGWDLDVFNTAREKCGEAVESSRCDYLRPMLASQNEQGICATKFKNSWQNGRIVQQEQCTGPLDKLCGYGPEKGRLFAIGRNTSITTSTTTSTTTETNGYTFLPNMDSGGLDIECFSNGETDDVCKAKCDVDTNCVGYNKKKSDGPWNGKTGCCYKLHISKLSSIQGVDFYLKLNNRDGVSPQQTQSTTPTQTTTTTTSTKTSDSDLKELIKEIQVLFQKINV
jgi:hypothetical protein